MKLSIISLMLLAYLPLYAEPETGSVKRTCQVLFLNKPVDAAEQSYLFDGTSSYEVALSGKGFSSVVELPNGPLTIYFSFSSVSKVEELAKDAPSVQLSGEITDFYLLVSATPENEAAPYSLEVVDTSNGKLKAGETFWVNLTKHNISATVGVESFLIPPKGRVVSPAPLKDNGYYPAKFSYQHNGEGEYYKVLNKTWRFQINSKSLGLIIDSGGRRPKIFTILDRR